MGAGVTEAVNCTALRKDGQPCASIIRTKSGLCYAHNPKLSEERTEARRRGGRNSSDVQRLSGAVPKSLIPMFKSLEEALEECRAGTLSPEQGRAVMGLAKVMRQALKDVYEADQLLTKLKSWRSTPP